MSLWLCSRYVLKASWLSKLGWAGAAPSDSSQPPGRASTPVARRSIEMRSMARFIVQTPCLRVGRAMGHIVACQSSSFVSVCVVYAHSGKSGVKRRWWLTSSRE